MNKNPPYSVDQMTGTPTGRINEAETEDRWTIEKGAEGNLADRIFASLKESIVTCTLKPGDPFNELEWARRFQTSRTPVREACARLVKEKLLVSIPNKGCFVAPITIQGLLDIYQLRFIVEMPSAEMAARRMNWHQIEQLDQLLNLERQDTREVNVRDLIRMNREFHLRVAESTRNQRIVELVDSLLLESARHDYFLMDLAPSDWTHHEEILETIRKHDPEGARTAMHQHLKTSQERMSKIFLAPNL